MEWWRKIGRILLYGILDIMLLVVLLFTAVQINTNMDIYYEWHYKTRQIEADTGMTIDQLMAVTNKMQDYLMGQRDSLDMKAVINGQEQEVFGQREKKHMVDVRNLFMKGHRIRNWLAIILTLAIIGLFWFNRKGLQGWLKQIWKFWLGGFLVMGLVGVALATNFDKYFILFHHIFFDNDLWILDPREDILINMVPQSFFFEITFLIILVFILLVLATIGLAQVGSKLFIKIEQNSPSRA